MMKRITLAVLAAVAFSFAAGAAPVKIKGVYNNNRYDDSDAFHSTYVGYISSLSKSIFIVDNGLYLMEVDENTVSAPVKDPAVNKSDFFVNGQFTDIDKALWANNFNLMHGNSGAVMANNVITTVMSRDTSAEGVDSTNIFAVRKWDATTGALIGEANKYYPEKACLQSAGMCLNPVDGKVYGLFYLTAQNLPDEILNDPDFFVDSDGDATSTDAGFSICTIDLETMTITPITPGLYYGNYVTFAINSEGRAFAMTSGGTAGYEDEDGRMRDIDGNLTGATLCEFDLATGLMLTKPATFTDPDTGETYTEQVSLYPATGYSSQVSRQSACFSKKDPSKMYWNGFYNSGKGFNENGVWANLPDKTWRTNGKYDTALYEVDVNTGAAKRIAKITDRYTFSCMWVVEDDDALRGDVNGDGLVNGADVTALYALLLDGVVPLGNPDVNEDNSTNGADVTALYGILLSE